MAVPKKYEHIDFKPTQGMKEEAEKGLEWREEYGRGGTDIGVARARDIKNGKNLSPDTVKRMNSYFSRHAVDKQGEGWSPGEDGFPSAGRIAWALWGGDAGETWSNKVVGQMEAADKKEKSIVTGGRTMKRSSRAVRSAIKGFKLESTMKSVQSMRKSLIEASRQAMLAADELEDAAFMGAADELAVNADGTSPDLETAMSACREISEHIKAAIDASEEAKSALRGSLMTDTEAYATDDEPVRRYAAGRSRRSLKARREKARRRKRGAR